ncbi:flagellar hook assembly protein FlgD [Mesobacillus foraminis]|uniref:Flagellar basal-body rod modification protein FlgD n=1 Tax=Mesobacillus foraminis TaxID=279826 RepID=A0A4R2BFP7_9BACI|nr:flagellar hook assembly protein FlgD [Mesobacillus foraminis]TCN25616.1 flagellar basal-body rod modification protein FlgD [Mesobacillus foraminis]
MTNTIDPSYLLSSIQNDRKTTGSNVLGKDDFLKILMTQLQNQDPMNPLQDKDFIAQMATFSSLEQMTNMNKSLESFLKTLEKNNLQDASMLIGKTIAYLDDQGGEKTAKVKSVSLKEGQTLYQLDDGKTSLVAGEIIKIE